MSNFGNPNRRHLFAGLAAAAVGSRPAIAAEEQETPDACAHERGVTRAYAPGPFGQIHYRIAGKRNGNRPLLMLHPSPLSGYVFEVFMAHAARDRLVIAPDTPGFGMSDPPFKMPTIADYADAMLAFASTMKLGTFDVMGYHTGTATALEMAIKAPASIKHLVLIGASLLNDTELAAFKAQYTPRDIDDIPSAFVKRWPVFRDQAWRMVCSPARAMNILLDSYRNRDVASWGHHAALDYPLAQSMQHVGHPTLVINPQDDLWEYTGRASQYLKNGRVQSFPGWTHGFLDTKAEDVTKLIGAFLAA